MSPPRRPPGLTREARRRLGPAGLLPAMLAIAAGLLLTHHLACAARWTAETPAPVEARAEAAALAEELEARRLAFDEAYAAPEAAVDARCDDLCAHAAAICELAERICELAASHGGAELASACGDAREVCSRTRHRVPLACPCHVAP